MKVVSAEVMLEIDNFKGQLVPVQERDGTGDRVFVFTTELSNGKQSDEFSVSEKGWGTMLNAFNPFEGPRRKAVLTVIPRNKRILSRGGVVTNVVMKRIPHKAV